jgi:hypothetical protein
MANEIIVTTGDLKQDYEIIGPVYFQVSNKGIFSSALSKLARHYETEIEQMKKAGQMAQPRADWGFLYGEYSVGQTDFEKAFFVAVQELKTSTTCWCSRHHIDAARHRPRYNFIPVFLSSDVWNCRSIQMNRGV